MPQPPRLATGINKPTPPTPNEKDEFLPKESSRFIRSPSMRRRPIIDAINRGHTSPEPQAGSFDIPFRRPWTTEKIRKPPPIEDYLQPVLVLQASVPRYLQPRFASQLDVDADNQVRSGSIPALVERLMGKCFGSVVQGFVANEYINRHKHRQQAVS